MTEYILHTTGADERWDTIAYKYYKNSYNIQPIIEANPHIPINATLQEGLTVKIPIEEKADNTALLPIWRQKNND